MLSTLVNRRVRRAGVFVLVLLAIEFIDEFVFGVREVAWPFIRADLNLSYAQIGILLGVPAVIATLIEPVLGILADGKHRRLLILGGGGVFVVALLLTAISRDFNLLLFSFILFYPASGAFVSLSQATLMDLDPERREQNMARWTFSGSFAIVLGPIVLGLLAWVGLGWRDAFMLLSASHFRGFIAAQGESENLFAGLRGAFRAARDWNVLRWLLLLVFADLMGDVLHGYLALYFVDVVGVDEGGAALAVLIWTILGLLGDLALIPLLERVEGKRLLRVTALAELVLFPAFLIVPGYAPKLILLVLVNIFNTGWYAIMSGQVYAALPGKSGTVMALGSVFGLLGSLAPLVLGAIAQQAGLGIAMWLLLLGPIALVVGLPRRARG